MNNSGSFTVEQVSGIGQNAFNPRLTAVALWLAGADTVQEISAARLVELSVDLLTTYLDPGYVERYLGRLAAEDAETEEPLRMQRFALDDAIVGTEATLRNFALKELGIYSGEATDAFVTHPKYIAATTGLRLLEPRVRALASFRITTCPTCLLVGSVGTWFGYRTVREKRIPQSWCFVCRGMRNTEAMDKRIMDLFNSDSWFGLSKWGKETELLTPWERAFAYRMGQAFAEDWQLTEKQLSNAKKVANKALASGYKP